MVGPNSCTGSNGRKEVRQSELFNIIFVYIHLPPGIAIFFYCQSQEQFINLFDGYEVFIIMQREGKHLNHLSFLQDTNQFGPSIYRLKSLDSYIFLKCKIRFKFLTFESRDFKRYIDCPEPVDILEEALSSNLLVYSCYQLTFDLQTSSNFLNQNVFPTKPYSNKKVTPTGAKMMRKHILRYEDKQVNKQEHFCTKFLQYANKS